MPVNGGTCTAAHPEACLPIPVPLRMVGWPVAIALDPAVGASSVTNNDNSDGALFSLRRYDRQ